MKSLAYLLLLIRPLFTKHTFIFDLLLRFSYIFFNKDQLRCYYYVVIVGHLLKSKREKIESVNGQMLRRLKLTRLGTFILLERIASQIIGATLIKEEKGNRDIY